MRFLYILGESGLLCGVLWFAINSGIPYKEAILFWCKPSKVSKMIRLANILIRKARPHKGPLISKANFLVLIWTQKWTKLFFDFCPKDLKYVKWKKCYYVKYPLINIIKCLHFFDLDPFKKSDMIILLFYMKISKVTFLCKNEYNLVKA